MNEDFNPSPPTIMHIDLNSCFATVEQQANPLIRGRPVVVAAYVTDGGCILAASREAKTYGVKTGMRVRDGKALCPNLVVLPSDPNKYRYVNRKLLALVSHYSPYVSVESIDEMVVDFRDTPLYCRFRSHIESQNKKGDLLKQEVGSMKYDRENFHEFMIHDSRFILQETELFMQRTAREIKRRIKEEVGEWLTVSIGISTNRYLAKVASGLHKPDGLDVIDATNIRQTLASLALEDLCGIKVGIGTRLRSAGIDSPIAMYDASPITLKRAVRSITGFWWWMRLHGRDGGPLYESLSEASSADQKSFGQSYALPVAYTPCDTRLYQILCQLVVKMMRRLRQHGYVAHGVGVSCLFRDYAHWSEGHKGNTLLYADADVYQLLRLRLDRAPPKAVRMLAVYCFDLSANLYQQQLLYESQKKKEQITQALDVIANRWGEFTVTPGRMLGMERRVLDRIAFGKVRDLDCLDTFDSKAVE